MFNLAIQVDKYYKYIQTGKGSTQTIYFLILKWYMEYILSYSQTKDIILQQQWNVAWQNIIIRKLRTDGLNIYKHKVKGFV